MQLQARHNRIKNMANFSGTITEYKIRKAAEFDLNMLWQLSFGYKGLPFPATLLDTDIPGLSGSGVKPVRLHSWRTGTPFYATTPSGRISFMPVWLDGHHLPICRLGIGRRKVIIDTPMTAGKGAVKEIVSTEDYQITIQGLALGQDRIYPEDEIAMIKEICDKNEAIEIKSVITDLLFEGGYDKVVVTDLDLRPARSKHVQPYEIKLLSDEVFDIIID